MTLFGAPAPAPAAAPSRRRHGGRARLADAPPNQDEATDDPDPPGPRTIPAFERRAALRDERHRLVSEVRRRDGTSHREINAWLNRKLGITSVEKATLAELEQSVELLVGKLTRRR